MTTENQNVETDDLRDSISAALDSSVPDSGSSGEPAAPVATPEPQQTAPESAPAGEPTTQAEAEARQRDGLGRFVPKSPEAPKPDAPQQIAPPKPPASWKPDAAQVWEAIPPRARAEIMRRENEINRTMQETAGVRDLAGRFVQTLNPFSQVIANEGVDPLTAITNTFRAIGVLQSGSPQQKAAVVADIVKSYGIDLQTLDNVLAGVIQGQPSVDPVLSQVDSLVQQRLAPFVGFMQQAEQRRAAHVRQVSETARDEVGMMEADTTNFPHFAAVREQMADLIDLAASKGRELSLKEAYEQACYLHPQARRDMVARESGSALQAQNAAAQRAKSAAVSVRGAPSAGMPAGHPQQFDNLRGAIEAAIESNAM